MNQESSLNQKVNNNTPLKQNPRTPSRLQRGAATPSNLTYDFEGVLILKANYHHLIIFLQDLPTL